MNEPETYCYHAYLLRLWREGEGAPWRAMVEDTGNGRKQAFSTLQHLIAFLEAQTGEKIVFTPQKGDDYVD